jgi:hypothetical protein
MNLGLIQDVIGIVVKLDLLLEHPDHLLPLVLVKLLLNESGLCHVLHKNVIYVVL